MTGWPDELVGIQSTDAWMCGFLEIWDTKLFVLLITKTTELLKHSVNIFYFILKHTVNYILQLPNFVLGIFRQIHKNVKLP